MLLKNHAKILLTISLLSIILTSCANSKEKYNSQVIIAALRGPSAIGMIKMIDSLEQAKESNIKVEILSEPLQVRKMMLEGSADFAILPMNMAAAMYNKGLPYSLVAVPVSGSLYIAGESDNTINWNELRGKRVNVMAKGMTPDLLFRYLLKQNNITPNKDVLFDYSFPSHTDLASALVARRATIGIITEPYLSIVMEKNSRIKPLIDLNSEWEKINHIPLAETALLVRNNTNYNSTVIIDEVLSAYKHSILWVNSNPDSAATLIVKHNIIPNHTAAKNSIPRSNLEFRRATEHRAEIELYLQILHKMSPELIGGKMPDDNFYR